MLREFVIIMVDSEKKCVECKGVIKLDDKAVCALFDDNMGSRPSTILQFFCSKKCCGKWSSNSSVIFLHSVENKLKNINTDRMR